MTNQARAAIVALLHEIVEPQHRDGMAADAHQTAAEACDEAAVAEASGNLHNRVSTAEWAQMATAIATVATERTYRRMHASWEAARQVMDATTLDQDSEARRVHWVTAQSWHRVAANLHQ